MMMKTVVKCRKTKLFLVFFFLFPATAFFYSSCDKDEGDPAPTCYDGIQNQGESGIDCGGPCTACTSTICNGNGQNLFVPQANNNNWTYEDQGVFNAKYTLIINGTQVYGSNTYNVVEYCFLPPSCSPSANYYYRAGSNGDIYQYFPSQTAEYLLVPANPSMNQSWAYPVSTGIGTRKVTSLNASISTYSCSYTDCLKIQEYDAASQPWKIYYYKKGIGLVYENAGTANYRLTEIALH